MLKYIKKIQSKPEHVRKQVLVGSLVVCMSLVFVLWIGSLGYKFGKNNKPVVAENTATKPFALFSKTISETYNNVSASVGKISTTKITPKEEVKVDSEKIIDLIPTENQ
jgi:hypothetical protein